MPTATNGRDARLVCCAVAVFALLLVAGRAPADVPSEADALVLYGHDVDAAVRVEARSVQASAGTAAPVPLEAEAWQARTASGSAGTGASDVSELEVAVQPALASGAFDVTSPCGILGAVGSLPELMTLLDALDIISMSPTSACHMGCGRALMGTLGGVCSALQAAYAVCSFNPYIPFPLCLSAAEAAAVAGTAAALGNAHGCLDSCAMPQPDSGGHPRDCSRHADCPNGGYCANARVVQGEVVEISGACSSARMRGGNQVQLTCVCLDT